MKRIVTTLMLAFATITGVNAQQTDYYLEQGVTVGCYGANPLTDITKNLLVVYSDAEAQLQLKSLNCKKDFTLKKISTIKGDAGEELFYDAKGNLILIKEGADKVYLYKRDGKVVNALGGAHTDKKQRKNVSAKDNMSKFMPMMDKIESALEEEKKLAEEKAKKENEEKEAAEKKASLEKAMTEMGEHYNANKGKIFFSSKKRNTMKEAANDKPSDFFTEFELGASPVYARIYFTPEDDGNKFINVKYSIGDISVSSEELRALRGEVAHDRYSGGVASANYFTSGLLGYMPLLSDEGDYYGPFYSMAEDAFRVLLSRAASKLTPGSTHTVKMEISYSTMKDYSAAPFITGEVKMKITDKSQNLLSRACMCMEKVKTDATIEKQVKELFLSDKDTKEVHKVFINSRDYKISTSYGLPTKRTMDVSVMLTNKEGWVMVWVGAVAWPYDGSNYSDVAVFDKGKYYIPVSPTCKKGNL